MKDNISWFLIDFLGSTAVNVIWVMLLILAVGWNTYAWYTYPCNAFHAGVLSIDPLPGRCVK